MAIQVRTLTHDGQGNSLPSADRQFISFSYGGRKIEDFGLIAIFTGDRLEKNMYADFSDTTTIRNGIDGQAFWQSQRGALKLDFDLHTDGMTDEEYEDFQGWFCNGIERELILAERPNRAIKARVASAPSIQLLPFEDLESKVTIGTNTFSVPSSIYKGDVRLSFVCDEPYWYSKTSVITTNAANITKDELLTIKTDKVPHKSQLEEDCLLAGGKKFTKSNNSVSNQTGIKLGNGRLYYAGSADERPEIKFSSTLAFDGDSKVIAPLYPMIKNQETLVSGYTRNDKKLSIIAHVKPKMVGVGTVAPEPSKNLWPTFVTTTKKGITFTVDENGWVRTSGTGEEKYVALTRNVTLPAGHYVISGAPEGGTLQNYDMYAYIINSNTVLAYAPHNYSGYNNSFTLTEQATIKLLIRAPRVTDSTKIFKPQLEAVASINDGATPYVKYASKYTIVEPPRKITVARPIGKNLAIPELVSAHTFMSGSLSLATNRIGILYPGNALYTVSALSRDSNNIYAAIIEAECNSQVEGIDDNKVVYGSSDDDQNVRFSKTILCPEGKQLLVYGTGGGMKTSDPIDTSIDNFIASKINTCKLQVELSAIASDYEAPVAEAYTVEVPNTIDFYGGDIDFTNGVINADYSRIEVSGTENINTPSQSAYTFYTINNSYSAPYANGGETQMFNMFSTKPSNSGEWGDAWIAKTTSNLAFAGAYTKFNANIAAFKTWLTNASPKVIGYYKTANPICSYFEPVSFSQSTGNNIFLSNTGSLSVIGQISQNEPTLDFDIDKSIIHIGGRSIQYTTPNLITSYNMALDIVNHYEVNNSALDLLEDLRENLSHYYVKAWAAAIVQGFINDSAHNFVSANGGLIGDFKQRFTILMKYLISSKDYGTFKIDDVPYVMNSKTGQSFGDFKVRQATRPFITESDAQSFNFKNLTENVSEMVASGYIIIKGGNTMQDISARPPVSNFKCDYEYRYN